MRSARRAGTRDDDRPRLRSATSGAPNRDRWLLSYADYVTLLLALFVVLYASARLDADRNQGLFEGLQAAFFFDEASPSPVPAEAADPPPPEPRQKAIVPVPTLVQLEDDLAEAIESQRLRLEEEPGASLHRSERGLVISLASAEFFPAGGIEIPNERRQVLAALAPLLAANGLPLHFEGHTDDRPMLSDRFPSNWELSSARAAAVARFFVEEHAIDPRRVATTGYAEFRPIADNEDPSRRAQNRRVEIVVHDDAELVATGDDAGPDDSLDRLLDGLPPIPEQADESLRPEDLGPPPEDIPLP